MQVTFEPTGESVQIGQGAATPQRAGRITSEPIYIDTPSGYMPAQGLMASGSSAAYPILGTANEFGIAFFAGENRTLLVTQFNMDSAQAVTDGLSNLAAALQNEDFAVILSSDGTVAVAS